MQYKNDNSISVKIHKKRGAKSSKVAKKLITLPIKTSLHMIFPKNNEANDNHIFLTRATGITLLPISVAISFITAPIGLLSLAGASIYALSDTSVTSDEPFENETNLTPITINTERKVPTAYVTEYYSPSYSSTYSTSYTSSYSTSNTSTYGNLKIIFNSSSYSSSETTSNSGSSTISPTISTGDSSSYSYTESKSDSFSDIPPHISLNLAKLLSHAKNYFFQSAHAQFSINIPEIISRETPAIFTLYTQYPQLSAFYKSVKADNIKFPFDIDKVLLPTTYQHQKINHGEKHNFNARFHVHYKLFEFNYTILQNLLNTLVNVSSKLSSNKNNSLNLIAADEAQRFFRHYNKLRIIEKRAFGEGASIGFFKNYSDKLPELMKNYVTYPETKLLSQVNKKFYELAKKQEADAHAVNTQHLIR